MDRLSNALKMHVGGLSRLAGHARLATVSSVNYETGNVRVNLQPDGVISGWLPILSPWVGAGWGMVCPPSPGDQVLIIPHDGDVEQGIVVGRTFSRKQMPPPAKDGELWLVHRSGSFLKLLDDGTIHVSGDVKVDGDIYDRVGSLAKLRQDYNNHCHTDSRGGETSRTDCVD